MEGPAPPRRLGTVLSTVARSAVAGLLVAGCAASGPRPSLSAGSAPVTPPVQRAAQPTGVPTAVPTGHPTWVPGSFPPGPAVTGPELQLRARAEPAVVARGELVTVRIQAVATGPVVHQVVLKVELPGVWRNWSSRCTGAGPTFYCFPGDVAPGHPGQAWISMVLHGPPGPYRVPVQAYGTSGGTGLTASADAVLTVR